VYSAGRHTTSFEGCGARVNHAGWPAEVATAVSTGSDVGEEAVYRRCAAIAGARHPPEGRMICVQLVEEILVV